MGQARVKEANYGKHIEDISILGPIETFRRYRMQLMRDRKSFTVETEVKGVSIRLDFQPEKVAKPMRGKIGEEIEAHKFMLRLMEAGLSDKEAGYFLKAISPGVGIKAVYFKESRHPLFYALFRQGGVRLEIMDNRTDEEYLASVSSTQKVLEEGML